mmetsp:Transcript_14216/g.35812  ORF Transcript_14216/g.35812 Transcript_14216/m.35812 type:complete len:210 (-) Transcript_14216:70-699(-)
MDGDDEDEHVFFALCSGGDVLCLELSHQDQILPPGDGLRVGRAHAEQLAPGVADDLVLHLALDPLALHGAGVALRGRLQNGLQDADGVLVLPYCRGTHIFRLRKLEALLPEGRLVLFDKGGREGLSRALQPLQLPLHARRPPVHEGPRQRRAERGPTEDLGVTLDLPGFGSTLVELPLPKGEGRHPGQRREREGAERALVHRDEIHHVQ